MILEMIKRALKNAMHEATEEWAEEIGLPESEVEQFRVRRVELAENLARKKQAAIEAADAQAAAALNVDDETDGERVASLSMPAAARVTEEPTVESAEDDDLATDESFLVWVHEQRQQSITWADIVSGAIEQGQDLSESTIRRRYYRWRQDHGETIDDDAE